MQWPTHTLFTSLSLTHTCAPHTHTMNIQYSNNSAPGSSSQSDEGVHKGPDGQLRDYLLNFDMDKRSSERVCH